MAKVVRFDSTAVALHWTTAALIVVAFGLGLAVDAFPKDWEHAVVNTHSLLGIAIVALTAARIAWRLGHAPPPLPEEVGGPLVRRATAVVHFLLYTLMVAVPLIGIPVLLYRGLALDFGLFQVPSPFARTPAIFRPLQEAHELAAYALIGLAAAQYVLAALYHHLIRRDEVLLQMLGTGAAMNARAIARRAKVDARGVRLPRRLIRRRLGDPADVAVQRLQVEVAEHLWGVRGHLVRGLPDFRGERVERIWARRDPQRLATLPFVAVTLVTAVAYEESRSAGAGAALAA